MTTSSALIPVVGEHYVTRSCPHLPDGTGVIVVGVRPNVVEVVVDDWDDGISYTMPAKCLVAP